MPREGILALDLASRTGWAYCNGAYRPRPTVIEGKSVPVGIVRSGTHRFAPPGSGIGRVLAKAQDWLRATILVLQPAWIVYEAPLPGKNQKSDSTALLLISLCGLVELEAELVGTRTFKAGNNVVKKHVTGLGRYKTREAGKLAMIEVCREWGFDPRDDNEADALGLMDYAASMALRGRR